MSNPRARKRQKTHMTLYRPPRSCRPEMKIATKGLNTLLVSNALTYTELTTIAQGVSNNERIGQKIRIWRVEVRGQMNNNCDGYFIQSHGGSLPVYADFNGTGGGFLSAFTANARFTEWNYFVSDDADAFRCIRSFPRGYVAHFDTNAGTSCVRNRLSLVFINNTAADKTIDCTCRIWYTDA